MQRGVKKVLVTGSNKGIGYGILETLMRKQAGQYSLIMTAQDLALGEAACKQLKKKYPGTELNLLELELTKPDTVDDFIKRLKASHGPVDVLVNNAGIYIRGVVTEESISKTMDTNYYGTRRLTQAMLIEDLINPYGKILFMSSILGKFSSLKYSHPEVYAELKEYERSTFTLANLDKIVKRYEKEIRDPVLSKKWQPNPYDTSKNFLSVYSNVLSRTKEVVDREIQVYSLDPGFCDTDMTKGVGAVLTYLHGAKTPVALINMPFEVDPQLQGGFLLEGKFTPL